MEEGIKEKWKKLIEEMLDSLKDETTKRIYEEIKGKEEIEEMIRALKNIEMSESEEYKVEFVIKLLEDGKQTIYNKEWWKSQGLIKEKKALPVWAAIPVVIAGSDVGGGIIGGLIEGRKENRRRKENQERDKRERNSNSQHSPNSQQQKNHQEKREIPWSWEGARNWAIGFSASAAFSIFFNRYVPIKFKFN